MNYIQLYRQFSLLPRNKTDEHFEYQSASMIYSQKLPWESLLLEYRTVILAEAGAGKTTEFIQQAKKLEAEGKFSFFIRIEDINSDFIKSFEVGNEDSFDEWLQSTDEAWFFLDSVDEARLEHVRQFDRAIQKFARQIKLGAHRCHIYISSRPYSWRFKDDEELLNHKLLYSLPKNYDGNEQLGEIVSNSLQEKADKNSLQDETLSYPSQKNLDSEPIKSTLKVYILCPLNVSQIKQFCSVRSVENTKLFIDGIQKYNLISLAERPFDLENMIVKWKDDKKLGSRTEAIQHNIDNCLVDKHNEDRPTKTIIDRNKLEAGAQRIAAMVTLTGKTTIRIPNSKNTSECIDVSKVFSQWDGIDHLVNSAIFNNVIYGAVGFRHREISEFLAAQWFKKLLNADNRLGIEKLFIREQFEEKIITPLLRPLLPWLIPYDEKLKSKILQIQPEIAFEGGDFFELTQTDKEKFLESLVNKIASSQGYRGMMHNDDIVRIAFQDLESKTYALIQQHSNNKDVIFFLARLAWKGNMIKCLPSLLPIALEVNNDVHMRLVCVRAIMDCSDRKGQIEIWNKLNESTVGFDHRVLIELMDHVEPDGEIIQLLLASLKNTDHSEKYEPSGLMQVFSNFVERCDEVLLFEFLKGLSKLLFTEPFYQYQYCYISQKYSWLMKITLQIIICLLESNNHNLCEPQIVAVLVHVRVLENEQDFVENFEYSISDEVKKLEELIPLRHELNDQLYWQSIDTVRNYQDGNITDDWEISWMGHFWAFGINDFEWLMGYVQTKQLMDDKSIAFYRAFQIYSQNDKPEWMLQQLKDICTKYPMLEEKLSIWLNPPPIKQDKKDLKLVAQREASKREADERNQQTKLARIEWIESLRNDLNRLSGELVDDHIRLMYECKTNPDTFTSWGTKYVNWKALMIEFGEHVAHKYYDAITQFWRIYKPKIHSEEDIEKGSIPIKLVFGLTGLEIEARENQNFPNNLDIGEVKNALRYVTWEMNSFPTWFEKMYQSFPEVTVNAVMKETIWALQNSEENFLNYLYYNASWLHMDLAPQIMGYLLERKLMLSEKTQRYTLAILLNADIAPEQFLLLAQRKLQEVTEVKDQAFWYALLVDSDPKNGISLLEDWLSSLKKIDSELAAQIFITHLMNQGRADQFAINGRAGKGSIEAVAYLKQLYLIMHQYMKIEDDIDRSNGDVYSPTLRDNAQVSRHLIFQYLSEVANSESYYAIKELANQESNQSKAIWMHQVAHRIATSCGNLDPLSIDQVLGLEQSAIIDPKNHKELFNLALLKISALKDWLENGDTSPFLTWQKAKKETEMRILVAGQLDKEAQGKYTISQEYEIANGQRPDIRFDKPNITSVPVELKILDKQWSGNDLCERLKNQLIGDYLREEKAVCGIFLLVAQNIEKTWEINGKRVSLSGLERALQEYWDSIASEWPKIDSIKVVVIDLNKRSLVSKT